MSTVHTDITRLRGQLSEVSHRHSVTDVSLSPDSSVWSAPSCPEAAGGRSNDLRHHKLQHEGRQVGHSTGGGPSTIFMLSCETKFKICTSWREELNNKHWVDIEMIFKKNACITVTFIQCCCKFEQKKKSVMQRIFFPLYAHWRVPIFMEFTLCCACIQ